MANSAPVSALPVRAAKPLIDPRVALGRRARWVLLLTAALTLALYAIPQLHFIAYPLMLISTVVHEMGHGMAAVIIGGHWDSFHMYADGSGYASTATSPGLAAAFVCAGGLVGPAVIGAIFLAAGRRPKLARWCLGLTGTFFALALVLWVRGPFGMIFVGSLGLVCLFVAIRARAEIAQMSLLFFATQLAMSVYSRGDYLFVKEAHGAMTGSAPMPSDVENMATNLFGPYWLWGAICAAFSAVVLLAAVWLYLRPTKAKIANPNPMAVKI